MLVMIVCGGLEEAMRPLLTRPGFFSQFPPAALNPTSPESGATFRASFGATFLTPK